MQYLVAYVGFFAILWSSWFQVVLHDVRFARDSIYERICKTIQFIVFVGLALVGSNFNPTKKGSNTVWHTSGCTRLVVLTPAEFPNPVLHTHHQPSVSRYSIHRRFGKWARRLLLSWLTMTVLRRRGKIHEAFPATRPDHRHLLCRCDRLRSDDTSVPRDRET
jgi:hypothetical protein